MITEDMMHLHNTLKEIRSLGVECSYADGIFRLSGRNAVFHTDDADNALEFARAIAAVKKENSK